MESRCAEGDFPVQKGRAEFSLELVASFEPSCSPPMTVVGSNLTVSDTEHGVIRSFPGTF